MKTNIFLLGTNEIPSPLAKGKNYACTLIDNVYTFTESFKQNMSEAALVVYLKFIEHRHFDFYSHLKDTCPQLHILFVVEELSEAMKLKLQHNEKFVVLWKNEEDKLVDHLKICLNGHPLKLRQDRRAPDSTKALMSLLMLSGEDVESHNISKKFNPLLPGTFENMSQQGSCLKIQSKFYEPKDFVNISFQNKDGEFISIQGQVRWAKWNSAEQVQELGLHFVSST